MENLNLHDAGPQQSPGIQQPSEPPPVPQLPPQMFTTAAQLLDLTDKKLMVSLRDGRKLIGVLRSWDQFGIRAVFEAISIPNVGLMGAHRKSGAPRHDRETVRSELICRY